MDVVMVRWPAERIRLDALRSAGEPRLVLVEHDVAPPEPDTGLEDWIRLPAPADDVRVRVEGLLARAEGSQMLRPELDRDGVVRYAGRCVTLAPVEARVLRCLLDRWGTVVSRTELEQQVWPGLSPQRNALDVSMSRLRRRLGELGLAIQTVRSRGYLLDDAPAG